MEFISERGALPGTLIRSSLEEAVVIGDAEGSEDPRRDPLRTYENGSDPREGSNKRDSESSPFRSMS